ncbi:SDR family NAD(P)-dependent oxidoreductase [Chlamydiifrater phoenicopteri]|uniref:SDR family NAD(P)-dependent oxidoreductase n=1 Tax=Chlamydiifrater phoenicopteri TaxID=2681469 RepID=UPI001BCBB35C|nr:SDR family NAD(P)-dependent oxidoreductase [Chlamydiifrater phoenicopteri]
MVTCITGAGSGIGEALALFLSSKGHSLVLSFASEASKERFFDQHSSLKTSCCSHTGDLSKEEVQEELLKIVSEKDIDYIIFCAGKGFYGDACVIEEEKVSSMLEVNVFATTRLILKVLRVLRGKRRKAVLLIVSSSSGEIIAPGMAVYGASKAYQTALARSLDAEFKKVGIRVLVGCPGLVKTPFVSKACSSEFSSWKEPHISAEKAARILWGILKKEKSKKVFPVFTRVGVFLARLFPLIASRQIYANVQRRLKSCHEKV